MALEKESWGSRGAFTDRFKNNKDTNKSMTETVKNNLTHF